jgi:hypothetical protein
MGPTLKLRERELGIWGHLGDALGVPMACAKHMRTACELGGPTLIALVQFGDIINCFWHYSPCGWGRGMIFGAMEPQ